MPGKRALAGVYVAIALWLIAIVLSLPGRSLLGVFDLVWWLHALTEAAEWLVGSARRPYSLLLVPHYRDGAYGQVLVATGVVALPAWGIGAVSLWVDRGRRGWSRRITTAATVVFWPTTPLAALLYHVWQTKTGGDDQTGERGTGGS